MTTTMPAKPQAWSAVVRRRVSIAGRVVPDGARLLPGGTVTLTRAPPKRRAEARREGGPREAEANAFPRRAVPIRRDGVYWFLDVPAGDYLLGGDAGRALVIEPRAVSVQPMADRPGGSPLLGVDLVASSRPVPQAEPP